MQKITMHQPCALPCQATKLRQSILVAIDQTRRGIRLGLLENRCGMAAIPRRQIEIALTWAWLELGQHCLQQYWNMKWWMCFDTHTFLMVAQ